MNDESGEMGPVEPCTDDDAVTRFLVEGTRMRGEHVRLTQSWREVLARHSYPAPVASVLGELMAGVALLAATLKFDGSLLVQMTGPGPVRMLLAQADRHGGLRALARPAVTESSNAAERAAVADAQPRLGALLGSPARLMMTLEPPRDFVGGERYQGVVAIDGMTSVAQALDHYFEVSEQLPTRLWLAADGDPATGRACGLLVQGLPDPTGAPMSRDSEDWNRISALAGTVRRHELLDLSVDRLIGRLFAEEALRRLASEPRRFACSCSRGRVEATLRAMDGDALSSLIDDGSVTVTCEFCNARYHFDAIDLEALRHAPERVVDGRAHAAAGDGLDGRRGANASHPPRH